MDALAAAAALASAAANTPSDAPPARPLPPGSQAPHKGRKVPGRREEVAVHYAISHTEDDAVIRQRLLTRTTTTRGEPPLKKLLKKFISFGNEVEKEAENYGECEKLYKSLLQELSTFELPLLKTKAVVDANKREQESFKELEAELNQQIIQAQADIEELKVSLEESKVERQHKEECEAIRRLIGAQPPRSETQKALDELERELSVLEAENMAASKTLELRKKQFALLLHVIDDLQSTIEEQKNAVEEQKMLVDDQKNAIDERTMAEQDLVTVEPVVDINNAAEPMQHTAVSSNFALGSCGACLS